MILILRGVSRIFVLTKMLIRANEPMKTGIRKRMVTAIPATPFPLIWISPEAAIYAFKGRALGLIGRIIGAIVELVEVEFLAMALVRVALVRVALVTGASSKVLKTGMALIFLRVELG